MKQLWLIKPPANELALTLELDPTPHDELVKLMAIAIESAHRQQANLTQQAKEAFDERTTTTSQD